MLHKPHTWSSIGDVRYWLGLTVNLGHSPCQHTWTLYLTAIRIPSLRLNGLNPSYPWITTHLPTTEGWKAELASLAYPQQTVYPQSGHLSTIYQAQSRESPPSKDRRFNHRKRWCRWWWWRWWWTFDFGCFRAQVIFREGLDSPHLRMTIERNVEPNSAHDVQAASTTPGKLSYLSSRAEELLDKLCLFQRRPSPWQPWCNLSPSFPSSPLSPFCHLPFLTGVYGYHPQENFGIKYACRWVFEHFRHKHQLDFVPLTSLFLSPRGFPWLILRRRGCLWTPLVLKNRVHTGPEKSWNLQLKLFRHGKSWNKACILENYGKSRKMKQIVMSHSWLLYMFLAFVHYRCLLLDSVQSVVLHKLPDTLLHDWRILLTYKFLLKRICHTHRLHIVISIYWYENLTRLTFTWSNLPEKTWKLHINDPGKSWNMYKMVLECYRN